MEFFEVARDSDFAVPVSCESVRLRLSLSCRGAASLCCSLLQFGNWCAGTLRVAKYHGAQKASTRLFGARALSVAALATLLTGMAVKKERSDSTSTSNSRSRWTSLIVYSGPRCSFTVDLVPRSHWTSLLIHTGLRFSFTLDFVAHSHWTSLLVHTGPRCSFTLDFVARSHWTSLL
eukprot:4028899-Pleurochrysis_carterae.AAC.2